jgi:phosphoribosylformylglycinamidine synthase
MASTILHIYKSPSHADSASMTQQLLRHFQKKFSCIHTILIEECFNIECNDLTSFHSSNDQEKLLWLLSETFQPKKTSISQSAFQITNETLQRVLEVGPRLAFSTAWSSNCLSMCQACGITSIKRIEKSRRYFLESHEEITNEMVDTFLSMAHDRMTECFYPTPLDSFEIGVAPEPVQYIQVMEQGRQALETINNEKGLGFDDWDLDYYTNLFREKLCRNPSDVEVMTQPFVFFYCSHECSVLIWLNPTVSTQDIGSLEGR